MIPLTTICNLSLVLLKRMIRALWAAAQFLLTGVRTSEARFMPAINRWLWLDHTQQGFLINGQSARLPVEATYQGSLLLGGMGTGKSSRFIIPNLLKPPANLPSFIVSDTSGEIYRATSGYLANRGYQIRAFNLFNPAQSDTYNPLTACQSPADVAALARLLVQANLPHGAKSGSDPFWNQAAEKLIRVLAQCLINQPNWRFKNLANLRHLVTSFDPSQAPNGLGKIDRFVLQACQNDPNTLAAYQALLAGNPKTLQSVIMSADVALDPLANPALGRLTASSSLDFQELRQRPTVLYALVNQTQIPLYRFLLNLIYHQLFAALLQNAANPGRPVWLLLDEFGHFHVEGFEIIATTARKYWVALHLALQSGLQLEQQYGSYGAKIIRDGLGSQIFLPGLSLNEAQAVSAQLGNQGGQPLLTPDQIIRLPADQALVLPGHYDPLRLTTRGYFQSLNLGQRANLPPAPLPQVFSEPVPLIPF